MGFGGVAPVTFVRPGPSVNASDALPSFRPNTLNVADVAVPPLNVETARRSAAAVKSVDAPVAGETDDRPNRTNPLRVVADVAALAIFTLIWVSPPKFVLDGSPLAPVAAPRWTNESAAAGRDAARVATPQASNVDTATAATARLIANRMFLR